MKKVNVINNSGVKLSHRDLGLKPQRNLLRKFVKFVVWVLFLFTVVYGIIETTRYYFPKVVFEQNIVEVSGKSPVLDRIAKCESDGKHFGKSGQVLMMANTNGTVDVGKYQINTIWFKKAAELGFDLTDEKDNELFAEYLYKNFGTEPWVFSKKCWNR